MSETAIDFSSIINDCSDSLVTVPDDSTMLEVDQIGLSLGMYNKKNEPKKETEASTPSVPIVTENLKKYATMIDTDTNKPIGEFEYTEGDSIDNLIPAHYSRDTAFCDVHTQSGCIIYVTKQKPISTKSIIVALRDFKPQVSSIEQMFVSELSMAFKAASALMHRENNVEVMTSIVQDEGLTRHFSGTYVHSGTYLSDSALVHYSLVKAIESTGLSQLLFNSELTEVKVMRIRKIETPKQINGFTNAYVRGLVFDIVCK